MTEWCNVVVGLVDVSVCLLYLSFIFSRVSF